MWSGNNGGAVPKYSNNVANVSGNNRRTISNNPGRVSGGGRNGGVDRFQRYPRQMNYGQRGGGGGNGNGSQAVWNNHTK